MKINVRLMNFMGLALIAIAVPSNARAGITTYTDPASFGAVLAPGSYTENFGSLTPNTGYASTLSFSGSGFGYLIHGDELLTLGLFSGNNSASFIGNSFAGGPVVIDTFTGNTVTAIGLDAFTTNNANNPDGGSVTVTVTDSGGGTATETFSSSSLTTFVGFTDTVAITSLEVSAGSAEFADLTNLTVGALPLVG